MLRGKSTQFFDEQNVRPFGPVMMSVSSARSNVNALRKRAR